MSEKAREAERDRQYQEYKDPHRRHCQRDRQAGRIWQRRRRSGRGAAIVRRDEMSVRAERFGTEIASAPSCYDVRREPRGPQIFLAHPIRSSCPSCSRRGARIDDGIVEVKAVARDPGSRAKIAVISRDLSVDPVGACVGMRGSSRAGGRQRAARRESKSIDGICICGFVASRARARRGGQGRRFSRHRQRMERSRRPPATLACDLACAGNALDHSSPGGTLTS